MLFNTKRLIAKMKEHNLSAIVAATKENIKYFTGFEPVVKTLNPYFGQCFAVVTSCSPDKVHVVHSVGEIDQILDARSPIGHVVTYGTFYREYAANAPLTEEEQRLNDLSNNDNGNSNAEEGLVALLNKLNLTNERVGMDEDGMRGSRLSMIKSKLPHVEFVESSAVIRSVRAVKTSFEIDALAHSSICIENAIKTVIDQLYEGINEQEIVKIFACSIAEQGAIPTLPMIKVGRHAVGGQRKPSADNRLMPGDILWFDCDIVCDGYWADIARVFAYKELKAEYLKYNALHKGQQEAIKRVKPGMKGKDVFHLTMNAVHEAGFENYRRHHVGHGIGLEPYELPILSPASEDVIEEGMILSIETPYYEFGLGALHVEDPIVVLQSGNKVLTTGDSLIKIVG
ncbi:Xaa-Pro peptidase family protein [Paenibacillus algorifonticola]|uniref:M24 family metallopeptidase n=1 Tax=Paenibacillus algorifonticola TaxID=684063 RepID=UPI003D284275